MAAADGASFQTAPSLQDIADSAPDMPRMRPHRRTRRLANKLFLHGMRWQTCKVCWRITTKTLGIYQAAHRLFHDMQRTTKALSTGQA
ncbi:unnamed protein product, partial [Aphanomyces euteiches]